MKKLYLLKTFLLACLFSIVGGGMAWAEPETETLDFSSMGFSKTKPTDMTSWKPGPEYSVSVAFAKGAPDSTKPQYYDNGSAIRLYSNNEVTVSSPDGTTLTSIDFSFGESDGKNTITTKNGTYDASNHKWTPTTPTNSVTFQIGYLQGKNRRLRKLTITYEPSSSTSSPSFRFAQTVYSVMINTAFTAPTVETNVEGTPTYRSSDPNVATVDSQTGAVTLLAPGTTIITATLDTHSASYTLTVTPLPATVFAPVTAQSEVVAGGTYIVLNKGGNVAMGERTGTNYFLTPAAVELNNGLYTGSVDGTGEPYAFTLVKDEGYFQLKHGSTYLYGVSSSSANTYWAALDASKQNNYRWTIDLANGYYSPIVNIATARLLCYIGDSKRFASYKTNTQNSSAVLYRQYGAEEVTLTIRDAGYATYYSDKAFVVPAGMEATTVTAANNDGTLTMAWEYKAGSIVSAATAVLLRGEAATYNAIQLTDCTVAAPTGNLLHGSTIDAETKGGAKYYKLTYGTIDGQRKFGFFWGAANGDAFTNAAGKAYLAVPAEIAATGFRLDGMDATGIGQVEVGSQHANAAYSLSGVRVDSSKPLPAGAYIINGRKVIVK